MKKFPFKKNESGYHEAAKKILAEWVDGIMEVPFYIDGSIVFTPDVTVYENGIMQCIYEVVHTNPLTAKKYGDIQYWTYRKFTPLTVHEISADYILSQTEKPDIIRSIETYIVDPFEYEEIQDDLIKPIS